jgi:hypothetical protein
MPIISAIFPQLLSQAVLYLVFPSPPRTGSLYQHYLHGLDSHRYAGTFGKEVH